MKFDRISVLDDDCVYSGRYVLSGFGKVENNVLKSADKLDPTEGFSPIWMNSNGKYCTHFIWYNQAEESLELHYKFTDSNYTTPHLICRKGLKNTRSL